MRVIAGEFRSRRLCRPPPGVRPTSDRVREALFDSLGAVDGAKALDLYAGTGSLGIEALSRGAISAVFVDTSRRSVGVLQQNLSSLDLSERTRVMVLDARAALRRLEEEGERFDLVFLDPPYGSVETGAVTTALAETPVLAPGGQVVVESATRETVAWDSGLDLRFERCYGETRITRFEKS